MYSMTTWRIAATAVSLAALAACQESAAPGAVTFDSQRVMSGMDAVQAAGSAPSVGALRQMMRLSGGVASALVVRGASSGVADASTRIAQSALDAQVLAVTVLNPGVLGQTLVYDTAAHHYMVSGRSGAPANGVRIVLYAQSPDSQPVIAQETGYAELTNEAPLTTTTGAVRLVVVTGGMTRLSYGVSFTLPGVSPQLTVDGFIDDTGQRLEFTISATPSTTTSGVGIVNATLRVPTAGVEVVATVHAAPAGSGAVDLVIVSGTDRITVGVAMSGGQVDASFTVNGALLARASGPSTAPAIVGANGHALTSEQQHALARIVSATDNILQLLSGLTAPASAVVEMALAIGR